MIHFVVHEDGDSVGTIVVEGVKKGAKLTGWVMEQDKMVTLADAQRDPDRPQGRAAGPEEGRHRHQVRRRHRARRRADQGRRAPARAQRQDKAVVTPRSGFAASPKGGNTGGPAEPDPRRSLDQDHSVQGIPMPAISKKTTFLGYRRENGRVGVRNHVIILPVDDISNAACEAVANNIKGTMALPHPYGRLQFGADLELHFRTLIGTGSNPNVAAVVVIGIEPAWTKLVADGIAKTGKPVQSFSISQQRRPRDDHERVESRPRAGAVGLGEAARGLPDQRSVGVHQVRRVRHDLGLRLQSDRRQRLRQALRPGHDAVLRRDQRADRWRAPGGRALPHARRCASSSWPCSTSTRP